MFDIGEDIARWLGAFPLLWAPFLIFVWVFIIKPILRPYEKDRLDKTKLRKYSDDTNSSNDGNTVTRSSGDIYGQDDYEDLLRKTQQAWLNDELGEFEPNAINVAADLQTIENAFSAHNAAILFAFRNGDPEPDEYLVSAMDGGIRISFVVTNKFFYCFGLDQGLLANKYEPRKVGITAIEKIDSIKKMVTHHMTLHLKSGERLVVKDLLDDYPVRYISYRLNQQDLCESSNINNVTEDGHVHQR